MRRYPARILATSRPKCSPMRARPMSLSDIPNDAPIMVRGDADVCAKAQAAWRAGLVAIVCIGETEAERDAGKTLDVLGAQLDGSLPDGTDARATVVAYEPVWAIGTGRTPSNQDIADVHGFIRDRVRTRFGAQVADGMRILYGGSVKPTNAAEIFAIKDVDGGLVGGASLRAEDFRSDHRRRQRLGGQLS